MVNVVVAVPRRIISIALIGNPNTGKTTLFNALTGLRQRVGNYPGVTVEIKTGRATIGDVTLAVTDVPGTYSLSPRSPDELLAVELLLGLRKGTARPDVVVCILDASNLERNLYLASQVLELGVPTVLALNMMDVAKARGVQIELPQLSERLGARIVPIQANSKRGIADLAAAIDQAAADLPPGRWPEFPEEFRKVVADVGRWLAERADSPVDRYLVERALLDAGGQVEKLLVEQHGGELPGVLAEARSRMAGPGVSPNALEARIRYGWISRQLAGVLIRPRQRAITWTDRLDRVLLHRVWGVVAFLLLMSLIFQAIFTWAKPLMDGVKDLLGVVGTGVGSVLPPGALRSLVVDGIFGGVSAVLVFLPQIMILFGFLAILEDCGYMARAAFLMDKLLARCGLSGKSFIPMLSSFACAIPGVMATRTIEDRRDRLATILVAPLMSCSARLPIYTLLIAAFIPATALLQTSLSLGKWTIPIRFFDLQGLVLLAMYMVGLVVAPLVTWALKRTLLRGDAPIFLMELPSYKLPSVLGVIHRMVERGWAFVYRAGTLILASTILIWALNYYPRPDSLKEEFAAQKSRAETLKERLGEEHPEVREAESSYDRQLAAAYQRQSYLGQIGRFIEPAVRPLGWDWKIGMAAIASFPAREVVVAALGAIYSVSEETGEGDEKEQNRRDALGTAMKAERWPDGRPIYTIPVALSIMVFFALCCQCASTLAVIWRETRSVGWPIFTFVYMTTLAYIAALLVYQIGSRLG